MTTPQNPPRSPIPANIPQDEQGVALVITAIVIVALVFVVALVVDSGFLEHRKLTLEKAADAAALRASQLFYDGQSTEIEMTFAAREIARLNLHFASIQPEIAQAAAHTMEILPDEALGSIRTTLTAPQRMYFAHLLPNVAQSSQVVAPATASYHRREAGTQHYRHIYLVTSTFASMHGTYQGTSPSPFISANGQPANGTSKAAAAVAGIQDVIGALAGERLTVIGYGAYNAMLTEQLPVDDQPHHVMQQLTNREYATRQAAELSNMQLGAKLVTALETARANIAQLPEEERRESLVLVVSDGIGFGSNSWFQSTNEQLCIAETGGALEIANAIRDLGAVVSAIGIFSTRDGVTQELDVPQTPDEIWAQIAMLGRRFLRSLAAVHDEPIRCSFKHAVYPNNLRDGQYLEPTSQRELAIFFDEITSRKTFSDRLPRRIRSS